MSEFVDLHTHTQLSDGTYSPSDIVKLAKEKGLKAIAITDHDTIDGIEEAIDMGNKVDIEVIPGIEFSTIYDEKNDFEVHILGYFMNYKSDDFKKILLFIKNSREKRNIAMLESLQNIGIDITINDIKSIAKGEIITRAHFAEAIFKKGYVKSKKAVFNNYIVPNKPGYVKREALTPKMCIEAIKNSGGLAFLAHPTLYGVGYKDIENIIINLKKLGLVGIEAEYYSYTKEQRKNIKKIAQKYNLLISGGSDFHGENRLGVELGYGLGNLRVNYNYVNDMKRYINNLK